MHTEHPAPLSRRYLSALSIAAVLVLLSGLMIRRWLLPVEAPTPAPPSEASALRQLSRELLFDRSADYVAERVSMVASQVLFDTASHASAVRWKGDTLLTTTVQRPLVARLVARADSLDSSPFLVSDTLGRDWALVVGRRQDGGIISSSGIGGGTIRSECAGRSVDEYLLGARLHPALAGAGVFNFRGRLVGLVVQCGRRVAAVASSSFPRLLARQSEDEELHGPFGLLLAPLDSSTRKFFGADSGMLVTAIATGGLASQKGLRPGDVIVAVDGNAPRNADSLWRMPNNAADSSTTHRVLRRRGRSLVTLSLGAPPTLAVAARGDAQAIGLQLSDSSSETRLGIPITAVRDGSIARAAGLRPGDRLLRIGDSTVATVDEAERLLGRARATPVYIVVGRNDVERGILLPPLAP